MSEQLHKHSAEFKGTDRMVSQTARRQFKPLLAVGSLIFVAVPVFAQKLEPPPFDVINRHQVNLMSGTAAPTFVDVSIGGTNGLSHAVTTANSDFVNFEAGYGPLGPRDKYFGRIVKAVHHKPSANMSTWVVVMRAVSLDGGHDFAIGPGCSTDSAGNVLNYNNFTSYDGDPRHLLEYTSDKKGLIWTRPDGTRVVYAGGFSVTPGSCYKPNYEGELQGYGISRIEYPNGFTIVGGNAQNIGSEVKTNTGFQLTYIYVSRQEPDRYYGASQASQPWAPQTYDGTWGSAVPTYVVAINNTIDYCAAKPAGPFGSVAQACPGLTRTWPFATYNWPVGMPRVAYLTDRTTTFTITDATGGVTKYIHKPFLATLADAQQLKYEPRLYQVQKAGSDVPDYTYDYFTKRAGDVSGGEAGGGVLWFPIYIPGPAAQLKSSVQNTTDTMGYTIGVPYGQGGMFVNGSGGREGNVAIKTNLAYGTFQVDLWDKTVNSEQQQANKVTSLYRKTDGVTVEYGYDARFNLTEIIENSVITLTALYPASCDASTRKICNQPTWTRDAKGNQTDYEYDTNSGQVKRIRMPADQNGVRPEIRYEYQPKYAFYKRSAAGALQQADTPLYLLSKELKCSVATMGADGTCVANGVNDTVVTEYDYGPSGVANNLLLRGKSVTANAGGAMQTRRTCYRYDIYGNKIGETKPQAGLTSCN